MLYSCTDQTWANVHGGIVSREDLSSRGEHVGCPQHLPKRCSFSSRKWMCTARAGENDQNQRRQEYWLLELTVYGGKITEARVRVCRSLSTFVGLCRVVGLSVASEPEGEGQGSEGGVPRVCERGSTHRKIDTDPRGILIPPPDRTGSIEGVVSSLLLLRALRHKCRCPAGRALVAQ